jgi:hypothetical protein
LILSWGRRKGSATVWKPPSARTCERGEGGEGGR